MILPHLPLTRIGTTERVTVKHPPSPSSFTLSLDPHDPLRSLGERGSVKTDRLREADDEAEVTQLGEPLTMIPQDVVTAPGIGGK